MSTIIAIFITAFVLFFVISSHRYLQMIWWNITVFGWRNTARDIRGLTRTYMAISNIFASSSSQFHEFKLDLYRVGIRISCKKQNGKFTHTLHADALLNPYSTSMMSGVCNDICGDISWINNVNRDVEQRGYEILHIGHLDVERYGITPITIIYYHLTRYTQQKQIKTKIERAPYGSSRRHQNNHLPNHIPINNPVSVKSIPNNPH